jgi:hypothetical protein
MKAPEPLAKGENMLKLTLTCLLIALVIVPFSGCVPHEGEKAEGEPTTEFGRMLGYVPYSFLEEYDIWFINFGKAKEMHGIKDTRSAEEAIALSDDRREALVKALTDIGGIIVPSWRLEQLSPLIGFDGISADRIINIDASPPLTFSISEGNFDEGLIAGKLTELGYSKTEYSSYSYYGIREDFDMDPTNPLSALVLASMNRLAVFKDTVIASPATEYVTGIFDAMAGDAPSVMDNAACRALADSLGDVLTAVMTTPERIVITSPQVGGMPKFEFSIPDDWGLLHQYDMAALGYKAEGEQRFLVISLYYKDEETAAADGAEILKRMAGYTFGTWTPGYSLGTMPDILFTDRYKVGEPVVRQYPDGVVLTIACQAITEGALGLPFHTGMGFYLRDLLFLAPDPSIYIGRN